MNPHLAIRFKTIMFRLCVFLTLFLVLWLFTKYNLRRSSIFQEDFLSISASFPPSKSIPTIARVLYLFLCENQAEINAYRSVLPSITGDVMFFCWKKNCFNTNFSTPSSIYTATWSGASSKYQPLVRINPAPNYILTHPRVFIINELQLNLSRKTTWTTARNLLYQSALAEELRQGWRWAYFNFADGDIQFVCPFAQKFLNANQTNEDGFIIARHFRSLVNIQPFPNNRTNSNLCFILMDAFLLSVSPAIGVVAGMMIPIVFDGLVAEIVYHVDAMFNAFHRDALDFLLPYCPRYDAHSWWKSQAILIYRSLCLYGHAIQFNAIQISARKHRPYPRQGNPWVIDQDMNLVPSSLISLQKYMKTKRLVSAIVLRHYSGWSLGVTGDECRDHHTDVDPVTTPNKSLQMWFKSEQKIKRPPYINRDHGFCGSCPRDKMVSNAWQLTDLVANISPTRPFLVNIGAASAGGGQYDPTYPLLTATNLSFSALLIDSNTSPSLFSAYPNRSNIKIIHDFVWSESIVKNIFERYNVSTHFTILKLDIDSYECSVLESILRASYRPELIHTEFNPIFPPPIIFMPIYNATTKNDWKPPLWSNINPFYGCSLSALSKVLKSFNYVLLEVDFWDVIYIQHEIALLSQIQVPANDHIAYQHGFLEQTCLFYCRGNAKLYNKQIENAIKAAWNQSNLTTSLKDVIDLFAPISLKTDYKHPYIISS
ncbi:unnamed protein product [Rotaria magnacalcarata]|uniref:Uncharacterized protein n=1 Tax=Rotaria magnacalcarata TaxID=392030 RepID=A0A815YW91_9BILA|nr:unnamed protein product [Rotaria magnacalcarata]CAF4033297.1 unnamed protein product [Rotaria magnacalcarata]CAF4084074.1 unnamed protein product [Rotaria magnacalcarata]